MVVEKSATVEQILKERFLLNKKQISRLKFQKEGILKNGIRCRVTEPVVPGDEIRICIEETHTDSIHIEEQKRKLEVLYEDEDLLVVNKEAGMVTHPIGGHYQDTLVNVVQSYFHGKGEEHCLRPIGRLDKETSGIVVFSKNRLGAARLQQQRETGCFQKIYLAYAQGTVEDRGEVQTICARIGKNPDYPMTMMVAQEGKEAVTHFRVLGQESGYTRLEVWLDTGRTHQIRVHMASIGHPLLGDQLYGTQTSWSIKRAALHAWKVRFLHPLTETWVEVIAPIPLDMHNTFVQKKE